MAQIEAGAWPSRRVSAKLRAAVRFPVRPARGRARPRAGNYIIAVFCAAAIARKGNLWRFSAFRTKDMD